MGLDISVYKNLKAEGELKSDDNESDDLYEKGFHTFYKNPDFEAQFMGLNENAYYSGDYSFGFRAGSYSGYGFFRELLHKFSLTLQESTEEKFVFQELIYFSDCEGTIGPIISAKLHEDFVANKEAASKFAETLTEEEGGGEYFMERYTDWENAFKDAKELGAVVFH